MIIIIKKLIFVLSLIFLLLLSTKSGKAQRVDLLKLNTISIEVTENKKTGQILAIYYRDLKYKSLGSSSLLILSFFSGFGYGNSDINQDQKIFTLGIIPGLKITKYQRFETGIQYNFISSRQGFDFSGNETRNYNSNFRLKIGYRYEDSILVFSGYIYPNFSQPLDDNFIEPGISIGIRF